MRRHFEKVKEDINEEALKIGEQLEGADEDYKGVVIFHQFMLDLIGRNTPLAFVFSNHFFENFEKRKVSSILSKVIAGFLVVIMNIGFTYYTLLKSFERGKEWQVSFIKIGCTQLVVDIFIFSTIECLWTNYFVPALFNTNLNRFNILI